MYKINKIQGYIVQHGELQPIFQNNFKWNIIIKNTKSQCKLKNTKKFLIFKGCKKNIEPLPAYG